MHGLEPSDWVVRHMALVPVGAAVLDLACGAGRHGRWCLQNGYRVTLLDRETAAVQALADHAEVVRADLEDGSPWPLPSRQFAAVIVTNYLHRPLWADIVAAVAEGGILIYETFAEGQQAYGRPNNPLYLLQPGELIAAVGDELVVLDYQYGLLTAGHPRVVQRICAVRSMAPVVLPTEGRLAEGRQR